MFIYIMKSSLATLFCMEIISEKQQIDSYDIYKYDDISNKAVLFAKSQCVKDGEIAIHILDTDHSLYDYDFNRIYIGFPKNITDKLENVLLSNLYFVASHEIFHFKVRKLHRLNVTINSIMAPLILGICLYPIGTSAITDLTTNIHSTKSIIINSIIMLWAGVCVYLNTPLLKAILDKFTLPGFEEKMADLYGLEMLETQNLERDGAIQLFERLGDEFDTKYKNSRWYQKPDIYLNWLVDVHMSYSKRIRYMREYKSGGIWSKMISWTIKIANFSVLNTIKRFFYKKN